MNDRIDPEHNRPPGVAGNARPRAYSFSDDASLRTLLNCIWDEVVLREATLTERFRHRAARPYLEGDPELGSCFKEVEKYRDLLHKHLRLVLQLSGSDSFAHEVDIRRDAPYLARTAQSHGSTIPVIEWRMGIAAGTGPEYRACVVPDLDSFSTKRSGIPRGLEILHKGECNLVVSVRQGQTAGQLAGWGVNVQLDEAAFKQAVSNFEHSLGGDRLQFSVMRWMLERQFRATALANGSDGAKVIDARVSAADGASRSYKIELYGLIQQREADGPRLQGASAVSACYEVALDPYGFVRIKSG